MRLIAFTGSMGTGKSTAVHLLEDTLREGVVLVKFASHLYEIQEYIYDKISPVYKRPPDFIKDRKLLQFIGTEFGRGLDQDLWVKLWKHEVDYLLDNTPLTVVCDDCRFDNEAEIVKSLGGIVIKITSNKSNDRIDTKAGIVAHASEAGISDKYVDYLIENNDTLESYKEKLCTLYSKL